MAHRGVCPDMACELILKRLKKSTDKTKKAVFQELAEELGVPWKTIEDWHYKKPEFSGQQTIEKIKDSTITIQPDTRRALITRADQLKREQRKKRAQAKKRIRQKTIERLDPLKGENYQLFHDDLANYEKFIEPESIDAIITDPPYGEQYIPLYKTLSELAFYSLKETAPCIVMTGHPHLAWIIDDMSLLLNYVWCHVWLMDSDKTAAVHGRRMWARWKPLLHFCKGQYGHEWMDDLIKSEKAPAQEIHKWQQGLSGFEKIVEKFTDEKMIILDPFCGSGTTGVAAINLNRLFIGIDNDEQSINRSAKRLAESGKNAR